MSTCRICLHAFHLCRCEIGDFRKNSDAVKEAYSNLYTEIATEDSLHPMQDVDNLEKKACIDETRIVKYLRRFKRDELEILEVGPGLGQLGRRLAKSFSYSSTDITREYIEEMPGKKFLSDVEDLPNKFESTEITQHGYDAIIACDVFEHVLNEGSAILSVYENLKMGGMFYMRTPFEEPLIHYAQVLGAPFPFVHLRTYNSRSMKRLARSAGFKKIVTGKRLDSPTSFSRRSFFQLAKYSYLCDELRIAYKLEPLQSDVPGKKMFHAQLKLEGYVREIIFRTPIKNSFFEKLILRIFFRPNEIWMIAIKK
jgi:2-polyprenyl-3-methyl-5-hydroxy-6-metoxy-1,4-benzoquinol methylase